MAAKPEAPTLGVSIVLSLVANGVGIALAIGIVLGTAPIWGPIAERLMPTSELAFEFFALQTVLAALAVIILFVVLRQTSTAPVLTTIGAYTGIYMMADVFIGGVAPLASAMIGLINGIVAWPVLRDSISKLKPI